MRGAQPHVTAHTGGHMAGLAQAVAVMDLAMAGVSVEMGDAPFDWLGVVKASEKSAEKVVAKSELAQERVFAPLEIPRDGKTSAEAARPKPQPLPVLEQVPGRVWVDADGADVVLVVQGEGVDDRAKALALAMLAAVGMSKAVLGWVGCDGAVKAEDLRQVLCGVNVPTLVMGQGPLGLLLGRSLGVEGWHAAGRQESFGFERAVGVTYPLELLLKQPLFKRLAWQHLQAWHHDIISKKTGD